MLGWFRWEIFQSGYLSCSQNGQHHEDENRDQIAFDYSFDKIVQRGGLVEQIVESNLIEKKAFEGQLPDY